MAWESRNGRGRYYTRSRRVGGRVVREYVGAGRVAELAKMLDDAGRLKKQEQLKSRRLMEQRHAVLEGQVDELLARARFVGHGLLILAGYRQHNRSEWRQRREQEAEKPSS